MRHRFIYGCFCITLLTACGTARQAGSNLPPERIVFQQDSLSIDGDNNDWKGPLAHYDNKLDAAYAITNDAKGLYIRLMTKNNTTMQRILRGGLTVYINQHGVQETAGAAGISFPTGNRVKRGTELLNGHPEIAQSNKAALSAVQDYSLFGFGTDKTPQNFDFGKPNPEGIQLAVGITPSQELVYEASIPFTAFQPGVDWSHWVNKSLSVGLMFETIPGADMQRRGGGGLSIGGGLGFGDFGYGGSGMGISIGSGSLARIGGGKKQKANMLWQDIIPARPPAKP